MTPLRQNINWFSRHRLATLKSLRSMIGIVTQDVMLFNETLNYNIGYGVAPAEDTGGRIPYMSGAQNHRGVAREKIIEAAKLQMLIISLRNCRRATTRLLAREAYGFREGKAADCNCQGNIEKPSDLSTWWGDKCPWYRIRTSCAGCHWKLMQNRTTLLIAHRLSTVKKAIL